MINLIKLPSNDNSNDNNINNQITIDKNDRAEDDLVKPEKIRYLLQNLKETRENKIREGLLNLEPIPIKV